MVTQAIHDAKLLLRSHGTGGRERERERDRDGGGKMVSERSQHAALYRPAPMSCLLHNHPF